MFKWLGGPRKIFPEAVSNTSSYTFVYWKFMFRCSYRIFIYIYIYVWFLRISRSWPVSISGTRGKIVVYSWSLADSFTHSFSSTTFIVFTHCASAVHIKVKATLFCHFPQRHLRQWQKQIDGSTWWGSLRKTQTEQLQRSLGSSASGIWWTTNLGPGESWRLLDKKKDLSVYTGMFYT